MDLFLAGHTTKECNYIIQWIYLTRLRCRWYLDVTDGINNLLVCFRHLVRLLTCAIGPSKAVHPYETRELWKRRTCIRASIRIRTPCPSIRWSKTCKFYSSPNRLAVKMIKSRSVRRPAYIARMVDWRNATKILLCKLEEKTPLRRLWEDTTNVGHK